MWGDRDVVLAAVAQDGTALEYAADRRQDGGEEVWDAITIEELRPYFDKLPKTWADIQNRKGAWVGWSAKSNCRHTTGLLSRYVYSSYYYRLQLYSSSTRLAANSWLRTIYRDTRSRAGRVQ